MLIRGRLRPLVCLLVLLAPSAEVAAQQSASDLKRMSIEDLMRIDVTTPARQAEPLGATPAAISVITGDDIRRSGVTTIADALTLADGVHVARANNGTWAISARGFNQTIANKLLVMIDGRTVYSPLFAGVFWNTLDYVLEDVDRIEVIRGPGATLWGANAVNGVVNIITRSAHGTQGTFASLAAGNEDRSIAEVRYGATAGSSAWRVYGKVADRDAQRLTSGLSSGDPRLRGQVGLRVDGGDEAGTSWLLKADAFHSRDSFSDREDGEFTDLGLQGRWSRALRNASRVMLQSYYRREYRRVPLQLTHAIDVVDLDGQHALLWRTRHNIVWGGGFRVNADRTHSPGLISFDPASRTYAVSNVFVQDDITLLPNRLQASLGAKWEHNSFSGGALQPSARVRLTLPRSNVLWAGVSRAIRRPTRFEDDLIVRAPGGAALIVGNDDFEPESLVATEVGHRIQVGPGLSLDTVLFRHDFSRLRSQDLPTSGPPIVVGNTLEGESHGVELAVNIQPAVWWRTHAGYTWLNTSVSPAPGSRDVSGGTSEANDPNHLFTLRSSLDLRRDVELDIMLRGVGRLPNPVVPGYGELSVRVGWRPHQAVELSFSGQDLLNARHPEFGLDSPNRVEFERSVRATTAVRF